MKVLNDSGNKDQVLEQQLRELAIANEKPGQLPHVPAHLPELTPGPELLARLERLTSGGQQASQDSQGPRLTVLCRTAEQAEAVLRLPRGPAPVHLGP